MRLRGTSVLTALATFLALLVLPVPAFADNGSDTYIVRLKHGVSARSMVPKLMGDKAEVLDAALQGGIATLTAAQAKALATSPYVASIHKNAHVHAVGSQVTPYWDLDVLDTTDGSLDHTYASPNDGSGVTVYVLDSGIDRSHPQFSSADIAAGKDFVDPGGNASDCGEYHGTAVSSLIVGATVGAARGVHLVPVRVLGCDGTGDSFAVLQGINWVAEDHALHPNTPAVVNVSLGADIATLNGDTTIEDALQTLIDDGITVVAAAGNGDANGNPLDACTFSPARLPAAITVASVKRDAASHTLKDSSWSNYGPCVDLYAPGESDVVAFVDPNNPLATLGLGSGTSFSAPLTSAAAAQALHDSPTWTPAQVSADLVARAVPGVITASGTTPARAPNLLLSVTTAFTGPDPTISGAPYLGETLSATTHWTPTPTSATYQWFRNGVAIATATNSTYVVTADDLGQAITVSVTGSRERLADISGTSGPVVPTTLPDPGMVVTMSPSRLMDSRTGLGATGPLRNGQTVYLQVAGQGGVSSAASAVLVNLTCTDAQAGGYVTAYASDGVQPATSSANFSTGRTSANLALVPVGADGRIALTVGIGAGSTVQLVVDVQGFVVGGTPTDAGAVVPVAPTRLLDTRQSTALAPGEIITLPVTGAGVPTDAAAVFVNVTVTDPGTGGYLTVFPTGENVPATSNLNFVGGQTVPNLALVKVGTDGSISLENASSQTTQVVVDIQGYVTAGQATATGAVVPISPQRILDTRTGLGGTGPIAAGADLDVTVPDTVAPTGSSGVIMNLTATETQTPGWVSAFPTQASPPLVSNLNFGANETVPNLAGVGLAKGQFTLHNGSSGSGTVQLIADVFAYIL